MSSGLPTNLSLMKVFDGKVKHLEAYFGMRLRDLDEALVPWDPAVQDHSQLLTSAKNLQADMAQWKRSLLQLMASLWLEQRKNYTTYSREVEATLRKRHYCELEALFSSLRYQPEEKDPKTSYTQQEVALKTHLNEGGYKYCQQDFFLNKVARRQVAEKSALEGITGRHFVCLQEAADRDNARLLMALNRALDTGNRILTLVEQKVSVSHQASNTPNLYKKFQAKQDPHRKESSAVPPPADLAAASAPTGSAMDGYGKGGGEGSQSSHKDEGSDTAPAPV